MTTKTFSLQRLLESNAQLANRLGAEMPRLVKKWEATGLLEGLRGVRKDNMSRLLENQCSQMLRESNALSTGAASLTSSGQIAGFSNVAFPIVRRVFAGLIANELVSVQPMSLPSGLLFYLDYTYGNNVGGDAGTDLTGTPDNTYKSGDSLYNNPRGKGVQSGSLAAGGQYDLVGYGYSKVHKKGVTIVNTATGNWNTATNAFVANGIVASAADFAAYNARFAGYDSRVETGVTENALDYTFVITTAASIVANITGADLLNIDQLAVTDFTTIGGAGAWSEAYQGGTGVLNLRRQNKRGNWDAAAGTFTPEPMNGTHVLFVIKLSNTGAVPSGTLTISAAISDALSVNSDGSTLTIPSFETNFAINPPLPVIPEIDIRIESTSVTATTRKLRTRWSPEMAQDLTAFYSIDIEVELTNILSEAITLDIDREILNDLLTQAGAANYFWSRAPGKIVNKETGAEALHSSSLAPGPMAFVNVQEWYQTLLETITSAANVIYKKTLRGAANFVVTSPDVCTILEHLVAYKMSYKVDSDGQVRDSMTIGAESVGTLNNRYTVYKDPYFPSNKILVGLKGNTFLESGYIYAPYVPLILTPVVYRPEDFVPTKGIMTRYGRKMVRNDFYATVTVLDMNLI